MTVVAAVPLALAGWSAIEISQSVTREQVGDAHQRLAENIAESIKAFDAEELQSLSAAARAFDFEHLSPDERRGALKLLFFQMPSADLLALVDGTGHDIVDPVAVAPDETPPQALIHRATRNDNEVAAFRGALDAKAALGDGASTSDLYDVAGKRGPHQAVAVSIGGGKVLAAEISFEKVRAQLETFHLGEHGAAFLVDETGRIIIHRDPARVGEDLSKQRLIAERLADPAHVTAAGDLVDAHGDLALAAWAPIGRWGLVVSQPAEDALRASQRLRGQSVLWVFTALLFAVVLAVFYAREVSKPVLTVADGARKLASGDLGHRLNFSSNDEI